VPPQLLSVPSLRLPASSHPHRKRLEEELAHERSSQRVLEELLEPMLRSLGTHMSVRDVIAQQGGREEVWRALQAVVQEGQQAKQHVEAQGKVRSLCTSNSTLGPEA
jgi:hypothetical protein